MRVMRVDDQRLGHFLRRTGKLRQDQHTRIGLVLGGNIFLGHQVHSVKQRRYEADFGQAKQHREFVARQGAMYILHRSPVDRAEAAIDMTGKMLQFQPDLLVGFDIIAGRRGDLQQPHLTVKFRVPGQEGFVTCKPLRQTL